MFAAVVVAAALSLAAQNPQAAPQEAPRGTAVELGDVEVTGRPLDQMIGDFVDAVAEPNRGHGLARWNGEICVGVANLRAEAAQYLSDRISTVAEDLGLPIGEPGCEANLLVVATNDAGGLAETLVRDQRRAFRMGGAGMNRGGDALRDFVETDRPVRWWQMAMPVDAETGTRATRLPGDCEAPFCGAEMNTVMGYAPTTEVFAASRLRTQIVNNIIRTVVIVDVDQVDELSILQLADYIAMVSLAQVDPAADAGAYASILNVFTDPGSAPSLTEWDQAYLGGLYRAERNDATTLGTRQDMVDSIRRSREALREEGDAAGEGED